MLAEMLPFMLVGTELREEVGDGAWRAVCEVVLVEFIEASIKLKCGDGLAISSLNKTWQPQLWGGSYDIV